MPIWILTLFQSKLARQIGTALLFVMAIVTFGQVKKREGRNEENAKQKEVDREHADNIRDRVRNAKRVRNDDIKYRD